MWWLFGIVGAVLLVAFLYWQLIIAEGAYMGRKVVALLYDWSAHVYDRIKQYDTGYETYFLARPLTSALFSFPSPLILDVATGTARLARTVMQEVGFRGRIIGVDISRKMLQQAARKTARYGDRVTLVWDDASQLTFPDDAFEVVACLEALEFMPNPDQVLTEMVRVLRPGGILMATNRIGNEARLMPGRTLSSEALYDKLQALGLEMIQIQPWQVDYDLVWALKPGVCTPLPSRKLADVMICPLCGEGVTRRSADDEANAYQCPQGHVIPISNDGIVEVLGIDNA
jgi:ubiquinone/menaquinone biosynthesis C-methylase UbiE